MNFTVECYEKFVDQYIARCGWNTMDWAVLTLAAKWELVASYQGMDAV